MLSISKESTSRYGYRIRPIFQIELHQKDLELLKAIQAYFSLNPELMPSSDRKGAFGFITKATKNCMAFRVRSLGDLEVIIAHFDKYPLNTSKMADFALFKRAVYMLIRKEHTSAEGLQEILNIRASLNLGLTRTLKEAFPSTKPVTRPSVEYPVTLRSP